MNKTIILILLILHFKGSIYAQVYDALGDLNYADTLEFRPLHDWLVINNPDSNIWETGIAKSPYFGNQNHKGLAMITDTAGYYPVNINDYFIISIPYSENIWGEGILTFYHKFDTDTLTDGGLIEISYDKGVSWINVIKDSKHINTNFIGLYEDTISGGEPAFSGRSNGWQYAELYWHWIALVKKSAPMMADTILVKFRFRSDNEDHPREGWMIDDIVFRGYDVIGNIAENQTYKFNIYPTRVKDYIYIESLHSAPEKLEFEIFDISGRKLKTTRLTTFDINISELPPGPYLYHIKENTKILQCGRFIKY